jgi:hypothetical protein
MPVLIKGNGRRGFEDEDIPKTKKKKECFLRNR